MINFVSKAGNRELFEHYFTALLIQFVLHIYAKYFCKEVFL